jgi:hypothetical protein
MCGWRLSHQKDGKEKEKSANHLIRYVVNTHTGTFDLHNISMFSLPCFHYILVRQKYRVDQQHQLVQESHFDHQ